MSYQLKEPYQKSGHRRWQEEASYQPQMDNLIISKNKDNWLADNK